MDVPIEIFGHKENAGQKCQRSFFSNQGMCLFGSISAFLFTIYPK